MGIVSNTTKFEEPISTSLVVYFLQPTFRLSSLNIGQYIHRVLQFNAAN